MKSWADADTDVLNNNMADDGTTIFFLCYLILFCTKKTIELQIEYL